MTEKMAKEKALAFSKKAKDGAVIASVPAGIKLTEDYYSSEILEMVRKRIKEEDNPIKITVALKGKFFALVFGYAESLQDSSYMNRWWSMSIDLNKEIVDVKIFE